MDTAQVVAIIVPDGVTGLQTCRWAFRHGASAFVETTSFDHVRLSDMA
jgi:hypothetical protein